MCSDKKAAIRQLVISGSLLGRDSTYWLLKGGVVRLPASAEIRNSCTTCSRTTHLRHSFVVQKLMRLISPIINHEPSWYQQLMSIITVTSIGIGSWLLFITNAVLIVNVWLNDEYNHTEQNLSGDGVRMAFGNQFAIAIYFCVATQSCVGVIDYLPAQDVSAKCAIDYKCSTVIIIDRLVHFEARSWLGDAVASAIGFFLLTHPSVSIWN